MNKNKLIVSVTTCVALLAASCSSSPGAEEAVAESLNETYPDLSQGSKDCIVDATMPFIDTESLEADISDGGIVNVNSHFTSDQNSIAKAQLGCMSNEELSKEVSKIIPSIPEEQISCMIENVGVDALIDLGSGAGDPASIGTAMESCV